MTDPLAARVEAIEEVLRLREPDLFRIVSRRSDCQCAHPAALHPEPDTCRGTGATMTYHDPGVPRDEPCSCTGYRK